LSRYGRLGSTSRVRFYQYQEYLAAHGVELTVQPFLEDEYIRRLYGNLRQSPVFIARAYLRRLGVLFQARQYDLAWVEKELFPWLPAWFEALLPVPYLVDYDDAVFHRYDLHRNGLVRAVLGRKIDAVMRRAALVAAGNAYIADRARQAGAGRIEHLPTVIDMRRYQPAPDRGSGPFRIGWIGAPVTAPYLQQVREPLETVCADGDAVVTMVGGRADLGSRVPLEFREWREADEVSEIQRFDIGIMPLPDEPFERGKCGYKIIQYMGCGLPVVASPVGVNRTIVEHGVNGFLAESQADWVQAVQALRADPALRRRMGAAGRAKVAQHYSLQTTAPQLLQMMSALTHPERVGGFE
jgi:glycosyltransferase involved in cell wall biosynthesis